MMLARSILNGSCATDPDEIVRTIAVQVEDVEKVVHESGPLSIWLARELIKRQVPVVCIDARPAHKVLSARMNKSDKRMPSDWRNWPARVGMARSTLRVRQAISCALSFQHESD